MRMSIDWAAQIGLAQFGLAQFGSAQIWFAQLASRSDSPARLLRLMS